ncbi:MAG: hypothetical protein WAM28_00695 [Chlamydiales bacterium]
MSIETCSYSPYSSLQPAEQTNSQPQSIDISNIGLDRQNGAAPPLRGRNIAIREGGSLDEECTQVTLNLLNNKITLPLQKLEDSPFFSNTSLKVFKEGIEGEFDLGELNKQFPHLQKAIEVLFLGNKEFDFITGKIFWEIRKVADYFQCKQAEKKFLDALKDHVLEKSSQIEDFLIKTHEIPKLFGHLVKGDKGFSDLEFYLYEICDYFKRKGGCDDPKNNILIFLADSIREMQVFNNNIIEKIQIYRILNKLYLGAGLKEQADEALNAYSSYRTKISWWERLKIDFEETIKDLNAY